MGQEASLPVNQGDSLEEQARAPPSTSNHDPVTGSTNLSRTGVTGASRSGRKIMGAMFRHSINHSGGSTSPSNHSDYDQRVSTGGGLIYMREDGTSDDFANSHSSYDHHVSHHTPAHHERDVPNTFIQKSGLTFADPHQIPAANAQHMNSLQQPVVGIMFEKQPSAKKGLFSSRSTRSVINTMRNLTLAGTLRKQKEVENWEKQWDDDEDDDSDSEDAESEERFSSPQHGIQTHGAHTSAVGSPMRILPAGPSQQSGTINTTQPLSTTGQAYETQQLLDLSVNEAPISPPRLQHHQITPSPASPTGEPALMVDVSQQIAEDLLSKTTSEIVTPHQSSSCQPDSNSDWNNSVQSISSLEDYDNKPNVQMFMPMLRVLGKGSFGKVVLVQKREGKERGQLFAMKILKKTHLVKRRQIERTRTERKVLSVVNHPFIMKLHYAFQSEDKLYLVLDYCPGGELFFHLSRFRRFPERVARFYAAELLLAIGHLHKRGIIYRDLKPENVLLDAEGHLKLGDFGLAKSGITHPLTGASSMCGTPEYMAPEVLAQTGHGFCVDYWGLGMIVYEMMTGLPPWYTTDRQQLFRRLKSAPLDIPPYFSIASANCVSALLERNPRRRLGVSGIRSAMDHEFFRNISWRSLYSRRVEAPVRPCEGWRPPEPVVVKSPPAESSTNPFSESSLQSTTLNNGIHHLDTSELDTATQNFDNQFTRMPVDSEDHAFDPAAEGINPEELNEHTFLGFSFDIVKHREEEAANLSTLCDSSNFAGDHSQNLADVAAAPQSM